MESIKVVRSTGLDSMVVVDDSLLYATNTQIFLWPCGQGELQPLILARSANRGGRADGVGRHARFGSLRNPLVGDGRYMFVADWK